MSVSFDIDLDVNVDEIIIEQLRELEFVFSKEFMAWFLGVEITQYLQQRATTRFSREGKQAGEKPWRPLAQATREERILMGYNGAHPINVRTGDMEDWVTNADSHVFGMTGDMTLEWPGSMPEGELYDKIQTAQMGKKDNQYGGYTPPRPVIRFSEVDFAHLMANLALQMKPGGVKWDGS